jgi:hypothetical protein
MARSMPTKFQALVGSIATVLVTVVAGSVVEVFKELQFYSQLPSWLKVLAAWLAQISSSQIFSGLGWIVALFILALVRQESSRTFETDATQLYSKIDDFSNRILSASDRAIRRFCDKVSKDKSTIWLDAELSDLRRRLLQEVGGHFGIRILDDPLVHGPLVVDPLKKSSSGSKLTVSSMRAMRATIEVEYGPRARPPTARESFRSILDLMKGRIRAIAQRSSQTIETTEPPKV